MKLAGFIVGPERSGTTLTSAFLSQHPDVYVINDPHYLNFFAEAVLRNTNNFSSQQEFRELALGSRGTCSFKRLLDSTLSNVKTWYSRWDEFSGDPVDLEIFYNVHDLICSEYPSTLADYFNKFHLSLVPKSIRESKPYYIVKIPDLARYGFILELLYPGLPVIFNVRHPICNIASIIDPNKDRGWTYEQIISWYRCFFPEDIISKRRAGLLFTRYEDLVFYNRETALLAILNALGLNSNHLSLKDQFFYPNKKVMRKTNGRIDPNRLISSLKDISPLQLLEALDRTDDIQRAFYPDLSLMKIIHDVSKA
ncbi:MAG: sulfotransferase [Cyanobacteria bacterium K_DeepCast_35m_m2_023]|nr:sulfotransferase [Cyanobacteria bacterium K_DeepCast_35m_m2_023]